MPLKAKILSEEEAKFSFSSVEEITPEYATSEVTEDDLIRLFAPHAHAAQNQYNERKSKLEARKRWLETIVNNQAALHLTKDKVREFLTRNQQGDSQQPNILNKFR